MTGSVVALRNAQATAEPHPAPPAQLGAGGLLAPTPATEPALSPGPRLVGSAAAKARRVPLTFLSLYCSWSCRQRLPPLIIY
jgi:hypothetical protein